MTFEDYVKRSVIRHPSLTKTSSYERSSYLVASHVFGVLGNGIEWAHTADPSKGGYLLEPSFKHNPRTDEYDRLIDPDYGIVKADNIFYQRIMTETVWCYYTKFKDIAGYKMPDMRSDPIIVLDGDLTPAIRRSSGFKNTARAEFFGSISGEEQLFHAWGKTPYPMFDKKYSCFWEEGAKFIQEDWRLAGLGYLGRAKIFFSDIENLKGDSYYGQMTQDVLDTYIPNVLAFIDETEKLLEGYKK
jgi:hypothetical protein